MAQAASTPTPLAHAGHRQKATELNVRAKVDDAERPSSTSSPGQNSPWQFAEF